MVDAFNTHTVGIDFEQVTTTPVEIRIDHQVEGVVVLQTLALTHDVGANQRGVSFIHAGANVERILRVKHADFGALTRLAIFHGIHLVEIGNECGAGPDCFIQHAIYFGGCSEIGELNDLAPGDAVAVFLLRKRRR